MFYTILIIVYLSGVLINLFLYITGIADAFFHYRNMEPRPFRRTIIYIALHNIPFVVLSWIGFAWYLIRGGNR